MLNKIFIREQRCVAPDTNVKLASISTTIILAVLATTTVPSELLISALAEQAIRQVVVFGLSFTVP